ncbi:MAG TPA: S9 family peptidase, partial [Thermoanaerobaculia bacterium]|nr:S9 family peptidase [Thermoanaerobaculia bacterium]
ERYPSPMHLLFFFAASLLAQPDLFTVRTFHQVAISPDGARIAWTERNHGITVADTEGRNSSQLTTGNEEHLAWSPDSKRLAYISKDKLYIDQTPVTTLKGYLAEPHWSPDGKSIAFLFIENAARNAGPLVAMSRAVGVIQEHIDEQRVAVLDVATKRVRVVSPPDIYVYHFDWSPDSSKMAAIAAPGSGDNNYWIAQLHVIDVASATMKPIYKPQLQIANPRWSPDGSQIAFIEGLMSDEGSTGGDLFVIPATGGPARNLTPNLKGSVTTADWHTATSLILGENVDGESALVLFRLNSTPDTMWRGSAEVSAGRLIGASVANNAAMSAVIHSSFDQPPEIWAGPIGHWRQKTHVNDSVKASWGRAQSIHWHSDEFDAQGWLLEPRNVDPNKKYAMIVAIHGGPASAFLPAWPREQNGSLAANGYFVFMPNPRGSYGEGEAFTRANVKDFGGGDLRDILSGVDAVLKQYPMIDTNRVGIWGWSYGGYMTMWTITQTNRFHAAVAGAGVADWLSYYGENDIDEWMIPYFGATVYDDPAVYAKSAPIAFIKNAKTPTLVLVGERDGECPAPQSFEFWHALKTFGVETQLVVYADEGHSIRKLADRQDIVRRLVSWFDAHLR